MAVCFCPRPGGSALFFVANLERVDPPCRELEELVRTSMKSVNPAPFFIGGSAEVRGIALSLEQLALRQGAYARASRKANSGSRQ